MFSEEAQVILEEVRALRRELSFLIPTETIDEYENATEIMSAYETAKQELSQS